MAEKPPLSSVVKAWEPGDRVWAGFGGGLSSHTGGGRCAAVESLTDGWDLGSETELSYGQTDQLLNFFFFFFF